MKVDISKRNFLLYTYINNYFISCCYDHNCAPWRRNESGSKV